MEWQLRVAQGEPLPETSQEVLLQRFESAGHAIEVRLCTEDPARGFLPQSGDLLAWQAAGTVRVDHALQAQATIPPHYDSMVAKFIAHRPDRASACTALADALDATVALGVRTNQAFLSACLKHPTFIAGRASTAFIPAHAEELLASMAPLPVSLAALVLYVTRARLLGHDPCQVALPLAWPVPMRLALDGASHTAQVRALGGKLYQVVHGDATDTYTLCSCDAGGLSLESSRGREHLAYAAGGDLLYVQQRGRQSVLEDRSLQAAAARHTARAGLVRAPMAGRIVALAVSAGQPVAQGAILVVLEAMKMEHPAHAPVAAIVKRVCVDAGAQVAAGTVLVELETNPHLP